MPLLIIIVLSDLGSIPIIMDIITSNNAVTNNKRSVLYSLLPTDHREIQDATENLIKVSRYSNIIVLFGNL